MAKHCLINQFLKIWTHVKAIIYQSLSFLMKDTRRLKVANNFLWLETPSGNMSIHHRGNCGAGDKWSSRKIWLDCNLQKLRMDTGCNRCPLIMHKIFGGFCSSITVAKSLPESLWSFDMQFGGRLTKQKLLMWWISAENVPSLSDNSPTYQCVIVIFILLSPLFCCSKFW